MKLSSAFDGLSKENQFLKLLSKALLLIAVGQIALIYALYDKAPLVVERSTRGLEVITPTARLRTESDLKAAITLMTKARFETTAISTELFLNPKQQLLRETEQNEMKSRGMSQRIVVRNVSIESDVAIVDIDRVIAVGDLRSALRAKIKVSFEEVSPNELNPYGLLLSVAEPIISKEHK